MIVKIGLLKQHVPDIKQEIELTFLPKAGIAGFTWRGTLDNLQSDLNRAPASCIHCRAPQPIINKGHINLVFEEVK